MTIKKVIYDTIERENKSYTPTRHNPSSASFKYASGKTIGKDLLELYLKWKGTKPSNPITPQALLRMSLGNGAHDEIAKILAKAGIKAMSEVAGKSSIPGLKSQVSYRVDGLHELEGDLEVLEVKSSTDQAMFGHGWGIEDTGAKDDHILQVVCYLNLIPGVRRARLLYLSRDSGKMIEFVVTKGSGDYYRLDDKDIPEISFAGIIKRWEALETAVALNVKPDPDYKAWLNDSGEVMDVKQIKGRRYKTDWQVSYSSFRDLIWKDPDYYKFTYNAEFKEKGLL